MKKFKFRLESYMKFCRHQVNVEEVCLKELLHEKERLLRSIGLLDKEISENEFEKSKKQEFSSADMRIINNYIESLKFKIYQLTNEVAEMEVRITSQQHRVIEARKRLKPVEKLKERREKQHQFEVDREVQALVDELHLFRTTRDSTLKI